MAEAHNLDLYICDICMENMLERNPKVLPCLHSFCMECLVKVMKQGAIECPTCRSKTIVPNGDVTELQVNFMLLKVKEHYDKVLSSKVVLCQLCKATNAIMKCQECSQPLCDRCSQKHNKIKTFADHHLYKFCPKHADGMAAYICVKCVQPVCSNCIIMEHSEHDADIKLFAEGKTELLAEIDKLKIHIKEKEELYTDLIKSEEERVKGTNEARNKMIEYHSKKLEEAKQDLNRVTNFEEIENNFVIESKQAQQELEKIAVQFRLSLSNQIQNDEFHQYKCAKERMSMLLSKNPSIPVIPSNISPQDPLSGEILSLEVFIEKWVNARKEKVLLEKPEFVKKVTCPHSGGWGSPWNIALVDENSVIITDKSKITVTMAYKTDQPATKVLVPIGYGDIKDTVVFGDCMYFIFKDCIIQKPKFGGIVETMLKPSVTNIRRCLVLSNVLFVLLCDSQIQIFDLNAKTTKKVVDNLSDPGSISLGYPDGKKTFAVDSKGSNAVFVYDEAWNLLYTLPGQNSVNVTLKYPFDTAFTQNGLIVADSNNLRLSLFDFNGKFVKHLLDNCKGYPDGILYSYPHIWIAENGKVTGQDQTTISLFRLCK